MLACDAMLPVSVITASARVNAGVNLVSSREPGISAEGDPGSSRRQKGYERLRSRVRAGSPRCSSGSRGPVHQRVYLGEALFQMLVSSPSSSGGVKRALPMPGATLVQRRVAAANRRPAPARPQEITSSGSARPRVASRRCPRRSTPGGTPAKDQRECPGLPLPRGMGGTRGLFLQQRRIAGCAGLPAGASFARASMAALSRIPMRSRTPPDWRRDALPRQGSREIPVGPCTAWSWRLVSGAAKRSEWHDPSMWGTRRDSPELARIKVLATAARPPPPTIGCELVADARRRAVR